MKRSVAIVGATPMFVRWAIEHPCPLREIYPQRLAETTFRQLRGVREISVARLQNRIHGDVVLHPLASVDDAAAAMGFPVGEIADLYGGIEVIDQCCDSCPSNAAAISEPGLWAGCYGWLSTDLRFDFSTITQGASHHENRTAKLPPAMDLVMLVEQTIINEHQVDAATTQFPVAHLMWHRLWQQPVLKSRQLALLESIFRSILATCRSDRPTDRPSEAGGAPVTAEIRDLTNFVDAISTCLKHSLKLHCELVPAGYSDGQTWTIFRHCGICKFQSTENSNACAGCGAVGNQQNEIKLKVLGIRPYLNLSSIFGIERTRDLLRRRDVAD